MAPVSTPAVLLRGHDYGDSSRILRFYTRDHGLLSVMAHGVRGKSGKGSVILASFATGELTAYVKPHRDLHTMKDFSCTRMRATLGGSVVRFAGAAAAAELVLAHAEQEGSTGLFETLERALDLLETASESEVVPAALAGLWRITQAMGFAPEVESCVHCSRRLDEGEVGRFDLGAGGVRCTDCETGVEGPRIGPVARAQVGRLVSGHAPDDFSHARQHLALVSDFVAHHVAPRPLKSLDFLRSMLPEDAEVPS